MTSPSSARDRRRSRFTLILDAVGQTKLAAITGIAPAYLYQISKATGKNARPVNDDTARQAEAAANLPRGWLDSDDPLPENLELADASSPAEPPVSSHEMPDDYVRVEHIDAVGSMGTGMVNEDYPEIIRSVEYGTAFIRSLVGFMPPPGRLKLVTGTGDSMRGVIEPGEVTLVDTGVRTFDGDGIYWIGLGDADDGLQIKMLQQRGDGIYVVSANSFYPAFLFPANGRIGGKLYIKHKLERFN